MAGRRFGLAVAGVSVVGLVVLSAVGTLLSPASGWRPTPYTAPPLTADPPDLPATATAQPAATQSDAGAVAREETRIPVRGDELAATVFRPAGPGPHPAVVLVHGAGAGSRTSHYGLAEKFARSGVLAVAYDKRADYSYFSNRDFDQLAEDAAAVAAAIRDRDDVDRSRVGLWGLSEGGRVVPLAASRGADIGFVISVGGAIRGPLRNTAWSVYEGLHDMGAPEGAARLAVRVLGGGHRLFTLNIDPPQGVWQDVAAPVLVIYGTNDYLVPPAESSRQIVDDLDRGGNAAYTVRFFGGADHGLRRDGGYAPGYIETMAGWIGGLPTATSDDAVAGTLPVQDFATSPVPATPWYGGPAALAATVVLALIGAVAVPLVARRWRSVGVAASDAGATSVDVGTAADTSWSMPNHVRRAMRWAVLAFGLLWAFIGVLIGLGYTRNGEGVAFQLGWGVVRVVAVVAVVAASIAVVRAVVARRGGWSPSRRERVLMVSYGAVAALMLLNIAYWGVYALQW